MTLQCPSGLRRSLSRLHAVCWRGGVPLSDHMLSEGAHCRGLWRIGFPAHKDFMFATAPPVGGLRSSPSTAGGCLSMSVDVHLYQILGSTGPPRHGRQCRAVAEALCSSRHQTSKEVGLRRCLATECAATGGVEGQVCVGKCHAGVDRCHARLKEINSCLFFSFKSHASASHDTQTQKKTFLYLTYIHIYL